MFLFSPTLAPPEIEGMARRISRPYAHAETLESARRIAEALFDLNRLRNSRDCTVLSRSEIPVAANVQTQQQERGLEERSRKPSTPSTLKRLTYLATVLAVVLNWRAAYA
jgi:hypothetical protein